MCSNGRLGRLTKNPLETALDAERTEHLCYEKNDPVGRGGGNSPDGTQFHSPESSIRLTRIEPLRRLGGGARRP